MFAFDSDALSIAVGWRKYATLLTFLSNHCTVVTLAARKWSRRPEWTNSPWHASQKTRLWPMGLVRITSWYQNFNGSHFGLPPSEIHKMTGLPPKIVWTMTYSHRPHLPLAAYTGPLRFKVRPQSFSHLLWRRRRKSDGLRPKYFCRLDCCFAEKSSPIPRWSFRELKSRGFEPWGRLKSTTASDCDATRSERSRCHLESLASATWSERSPLERAIATRTSDRDASWSENSVNLCGGGSGRQR